MSGGRVSNILRVAQNLLSNNAQAPSSIATLDPIIRALDTLQPVDVGLGPSTLRSLRGTTAVRCQHVYSAGLFDIDIFIFPPYASIPLHDHPHMAVLSRVLLGHVEMTAFDLIEPNVDEPSAQQRPAPATASYAWARACGTEHRADAHSTLALTATQGNVHAFRAGDRGCAIFDILMPPYSPAAGRSCNYYREVPPDVVSRLLHDNLIPEKPQPTHADTADNARRVCLLQRYIPTPEEFYCVSERYSGPNLDTAKL